MGVGDLEGLTRLQNQVASAQRGADRAQGALEQSLEKLREDFGCKSLKEARRLLTKLQASETDVEKRVARSLRRFEKKWGDLLQ